MEVTAEIRNWKEHSTVWGSYFTGTIWNDAKKRWPNGRSFHTSKVNEKVIRNGVTYIVTLNSVYICKPEHKAKTATLAKTCGNFKKGSTCSEQELFGTDPKPLKA